MNTIPDMHVSINKICTFLFLINVTYITKILTKSIHTTAAKKNLQPHFFFSNKNIQIIWKDGGVSSRTNGGIKAGIKVKSSTLKSKRVPENEKKKKVTPVR